MLALYERLRVASPTLSTAASAFGYFGTVLLVLNWLVQYAMFTMIGAVAPTCAEQAFPAVGVIFNMSSVGAYLGLGTWPLLVSWAVTRRGGLPRPLAYFGLLVVCLILSHNVRYESCAARRLPAHLPTRVPSASANLAVCARFVQDVDALLLIGRPRIAALGLRALAYWL